MKNSSLEACERKTILRFSHFFTPSWLIITQPSTILTQLTSAGQTSQPATWETASRSSQSLFFTASLWLINHKEQRGKPSALLFPRSPATRSVCRARLISMAGSRDAVAMERVQLKQMRPTPHPHPPFTASIRAGSAGLWVSVSRLRYQEGSRACYCATMCVCVCMGMPVPVSFWKQTRVSLAGLAHRRFLTLRKLMSARSLGVLGRQREHIYGCVLDVVHK